MVAFIYVCFEVVDFTLVFTSWDSVEPIRYDVCYVDVGCWDGFIVGGSFIC